MGEKHPDGHAPGPADGRLGLAAGWAAALTSLAALAWRGRRETASALIPINAPSHWVWGRRALDQRGVSGRFTGVGVAIHTGSALMWGALHERWRSDPPRTFRDAALTTGVAAFVDLALTPRRLRPGFDQRLGPSGLAWVYGAFAVGLMTADVLRRRRRRHGVDGQAGQGPGEPSRAPTRGPGRGT